MLLWSEVGTQVVIWCLEEHLTLHIGRINVKTWWIRAVADVGRVVAKGSGIKLLRVGHLRLLALLLRLPSLLAVLVATEIAATMPPVHLELLHKVHVLKEVLLLLNSHILLELQVRHELGSERVNGVGRAQNGRRSVRVLSVDIVSDLGTLAYGSGTTKVRLKVIL